jgi:nucleoside-diphosphate-sugar epimerase
MTVWAITGGAGHVGLELAAKLLELGHTVRLLDRLSAESASAPSGCLYLEGDVCNEEDVWRLLSGGGRLAEVVCHLAGAGMSGMGMLDQRLCQRVNVGGTELIVRCCRRLSAQSPVRLIFMSSYNVCFHGQIVRGGDESQPYSPLESHTDYYGPSKTLAEQAVLKANGGELRTLSLRPGAIFGERETRHLPRIVSLMRYGASLVAFGSASALQDWLHVENLVSAILLSADALCGPSPVCAGKAYFINDGEPVNTLEFMRPLARAIGCRDKPLLRLPISVANAAGWLNEILHFRLGIPILLCRAEVSKSAVHHTFGISRARADLGYSPRITSSEGMRRVAAVYAVSSSAHGAGIRLTLVLLVLALLACAAALFVAFPR